MPSKYCYLSDAFIIIIKFNFAFLPIRDPCGYNPNMSYFVQIETTDFSIWRKHHESKMFFFLICETWSYSPLISDQRYSFYSLGS